MNDLSGVRIGTVRKLIEQAPDAALRNLGALLASQQADIAAAQKVQELVSAEVADRRLRNAVLSPLAPLFAPPSSGPVGLSFPYDTPVRLWAALKARAADEVWMAARLNEAEEGSPESIKAFNQLCRIAAEGIRSRGAVEFDQIVRHLDVHGGGGANLAMLLDLTPLLRSCLPELPNWTRNLNGAYDTAIRLAFRDALRVSDDAAPVFLEAITAHLDDPYQTLRIISSLMDRPTERYLAASELAAFGERLLDDIDRRIQEIRHFDPRRGLEGGVALAASAHVAVHGIAEFESSIILSREGAWGGRIGEQKRALALAMETRLREVEPAVAKALPTQALWHGTRKVKDKARTSDPPDLEAAGKALGLLALLHGTRLVAASGGFGATRSKAAEQLTQRLDQYVEGLLDRLHTPDGESPERLRAYLDLAAEALGLLRDPQTAEIVRRRAAAA